MVMSVSLSRHGEQYYLSGVGSIGSVCWYCEGGRWLSRSQDSPTDTVRVTMLDLPEDLREELLAFIARAELMGPGRWDSGN